MTNVLEMVDYREAKRRSTSIYLPTGAIPMFPMELASTVMSLRQGYETCAVSLSAGEPMISSAIVNMFSAYVKIVIARSKFHQSLVWRQSAISS
jgi:exoribonuclease II